MTVTRFIFKTHKWLAVGVGLFTLTWFISGIVMVLPGNLFLGTYPGKKASSVPPGYREVTATVPQAIGAVEGAVGKPVEVTEFGFRHVLGNLYYEIGTAKSGRHLVNTRDGKRFEIGEDLARQIAVESFGSAVAGQRGTLLAQYDSDYGYGPLPVYRFPLDDARGTIVYVARDTGEVRFTNRLGRLRGSLAGLHTFTFLSPMLSSRSTRLTLILFSVVGTLMSVFGLAILCIQLRNWAATRAGAGD